MIPSARWSRVPILLVALLSSVITLVAVPTVPIASACGTETYETRGVVRSVDEKRGVIKIAHDRIGGFLPKTTTAFEAHPPSQLRGIRPGDRVHFTFDATVNGRRILDTIEKDTRPLAPR